MRVSAAIQLKGTFSGRVLRKVPDQVTLGSIWRDAFPHLNQESKIFWWKMRNLQYILPGILRFLTVRMLGMVTDCIVPIGVLYGHVTRADGTIEPLGMMSLDIVTTAGVNYIATRMANSSPANISLFNYHGLGTGSTTAVIGDTALGTELTTQYNPDNVRATGTQTNSSANVYQTVATNSFDASAAIAEWGLFSQAATGGGTLLDRAVFSVVNVASGDSYSSTFQLQLVAGS